jgi:hypothetical protein
MAIWSPTRRTLVGLLAFAALAPAAPAWGQGLEDKLVIVTSFPKDLTGPFVQAFEKKHSGTKVGVQNPGLGARRLRGP